jgi:hypothetical protein
MNGRYDIGGIWLGTHVGVVPIGGIAFGLAGTRVRERDRERDLLCECARGRDLASRCSGIGAGYP